MKRFSGSLILLALAPLLAACPQSTTPGQMEGSTGGDSTDGPVPTPPELTTGVDGTDTTSAMTSDGGSSSGSTDVGESGPPPDCRVDADCDDGVFCNGAEGCVDGSCVQAPPVDCDDGIDCTDDSCDDVAGECVHAPDNSVCGCGETCDAEQGCGNFCVQAECQGHVYACGDCIDNDGDCGVDNLDTDCWGPCDNNESGWSGEVPGQQSNSECNTMDCYFDDDSGAGNDDCYWSHSCDPLEPGECMYNPNHNLSGTPLGCDEAFMMQSMECSDVCSPLVPNGCDCFGCCHLALDDGTEVTVYLGTRDPITDVGTCNLENAADPVLCNPCTQVDACLNTCDMCELCLGETELPPGCDGQECPPGLAPCGQPGQDPCPPMQACITGCCVPEPQ